ncbi:MAG TPA: DUF882 domain-containing protein [Candidatus Binatia bacterium]
MSSHVHAGRARGLARAGHQGFLLVALAAALLGAGGTHAAGERAASQAADERAAPQDADERRGPQESSRFFLAGDGVLELENAHTHEKVRVVFRNPDGTYSADALSKIDAIFRSRGDDERTRVSLRLIELIDFLEDTEKPRRLLLISGYRSEGYNSAVIARGGQAARASMHTEGLAADLRFEGVDQRALWNRLRARECCGAGYYAKSGFVHVDTGKPRFWEESTSKVGQNLSKGNARVIARTDYDRYTDLVGAETSLHAITLRPLRVSTRARLEDEQSRTLATLTLASANGRAVDADGCITFAEDEGPGRDVVRVASVEPDATASAGDRVLRARVVLETCEPRLEATPARIESNPIEVSSTTLRRTAVGG